MNFFYPFEHISVDVLCTVCAGCAVGDLKEYRGYKTRFDIKFIITCQHILKYSEYVHMNQSLVIYMIS